jgi:glycosyltransferase 2 family protein
VEADSEAPEGQRQRSAARFRRILRWVVAAAALVGTGAYLGLRGLDLEAALEAFAGASAVLALTASAIFLLTRLVRAFRWSRLFPLTPRPGTIYLLRVLIASEAIGSLAPARLADLARVLMVGRQEQGVARSSVTLVLEKALDFAALAIVGMLLVRDGTVLPEGASVGRGFLFGGGVISLALLIVWIGSTAWFWDRLASFSSRLRPLIARGRSAGPRIRAGLKILEDPATLVVVSVATLVSWSLNLIAIRTVLMAVGLDLPMAATMTILFVHIVGAALPNVPGRFGTHQALTILALAPFGLPGEYALAVSMWLYIVAIFIPMVIGLALVPNEVRSTLGQRGEAA